MAGWSESYVRVNGIKLHYYRTGGDKPVVVINHGAGDDGLCWTRVVKELEDEYDVILPDARGHGKSASGKGDYSTAQRVADLAGLITALELDRPVVGGHSMGADSTLHLAEQYPDLTRAIFLEDPPVILPGEELFGGAEMKGKDVAKMMRQFMLTFKLLPGFIGLKMAKKFNPNYPEDDLLPWLRAKQRVSINFLNSMGAMDFNSSDPLAPFRKIEIPMLLFIGDREKMSIVSQATARQVSEVNPKVQVVHLEGASHDIRRTRFDGYMPALRKFLKEVYIA